MEITRGKQSKGAKFVVYGPEGIGKSTFVSKIPGIVFIDTEGSTGEMDVPRLPTPSSWQMLLNEVDYVISHPEELSALVIDTGDWAERLCIDFVCQTHLINGAPMKSIEDAGYGKGYVYLYEEFGKLLNKMSDLSEMGIHAGFTAHAMMRKFEQPDELGAYDRWELKMSKKVAPLVKEWSSLLLFANYKTMVYASDDKGKKHKAAGGQRVMFANHHPCWDAKNRYGLPDEMPFDFAQVESIFTAVNKQSVSVPVARNDQPSSEPPKSQKSMDEVLGDLPPLAEVPKDESASATVQSADKLPGVADDDQYKGLPQKVIDLLRQDGIAPFELKAAIAKRGYFPIDTPFEKYPIDFVNGVLIGAWNRGLKKYIIDMRQEMAF